MKTAKFVFSLLFSLFLFMSIASAIPKLINLHGKLTDKDGNALSGTYTITFKIYNVSTGGTALWTETQSVTADDGIFSVLLGSVTSLDLPFDEDYWLGITVETDNEMTPRVRIASAGYAYAAEYLSCATCKDGKLGIGTTSPGAKLHISADDPIIKVTDTGTTSGGAYLWLQENDNYGVKLRYDSGSNTFFKLSTIDAGAENDRFVLDRYGNVGIGTTSPGALFDIKGRYRIHYFEATQDVTSSDLDLSLGSYTYGTSLWIYVEDAGCNGGGGLTYYIPSGYNAGSKKWKAFTFGDTDGYGYPQDKFELYYKEKSSSATYLYLKLKAYGSCGGNPNIHTVRVTVVSGGGGLYNPNDDPGFIGFTKIPIYEAVVVNENGVVDIADLPGSSFSIINGNLGIGTTSPTEKLHVEGTGRFANQIYALGGLRGLKSGDDDSGGLLPIWGISDSFPASQWGMNWQGKYNRFVFRGGGADKIYLDMDDGGAYFAGNVGIGTTNPGAKLDVNGQVLIAGKYYIYGRGTTIYYRAPDGTQYSLDTSSCSANSWCCTANWGICFYKYSSGADSILQFTLKGSHSIACTLLHSEDDAPRPGFYFATDGGNNCYGDYPCFMLRREGDSGQIIANWADYYIICF